MTSNETMMKLVLPSVSSTYPPLNATYRRPGYSIEYSPRLTRTGSDYYDSKAQITDGRMSTAAEELAIQLNYEIFANILRKVKKRERVKERDIGIVKEPEAITAMLESYAKERGEIEAIRYVIGVEKRPVEDPRKASLFDDLFARNDSRTYMRQLTETGLRVPKGRDPNKYETDDQGRKRLARIVLIGDKEFGDILVPEGGGRAVVEWYEVFGIPRTTSDSEYDNHTTHFWFNTNPGEDEKSGHYDVAVARRGDWRPVGLGRRLGVDALCERWVTDSHDGFRLVRGPLPEINI